MNSVFRFALVAVVVLLEGCGAGQDAASQRSDSTPLWGPLQQGECTASGSGLRRYSATLLSATLNGAAGGACEGPAHNVMGAQFAQPSSCSGRSGQWDVVDSTCAARLPELPGRGADGVPAEAAEGYADLHNHLLAHVAFGESVLWGAAFGEPAAVLTPIPQALRKPHQRIEGLTSSRSVFGLWSTHDESGHPGYTGWPTPALKTHQQSHVDWLHRAYRGGLRLLVVPAVNNQDMFGRGETRVAGWLQPLLRLVGSGAQPAAHRTSNDMEALEHQVRAAHQLEQWVREHRGGWLAVAETPEEASALIESGKLAIVLGSEVDHPLNCDLGRRCDTRHIQEGLTRMEALGLAVIFPTHHKETQFGDSANFQPLNSGPLRPCPQFTDDCAALGLTAKGELLVTEMMQRGMLVDLGHGGARPFADTLALLAPEGYPLMMTHASAHPLKPSGSAEYTLTRPQLAQIEQLGGMVSVHSTHGEYAGVNNQGAASPLASSDGGGGYTHTYLYTLDALRGGYVDPKNLQRGGRLAFAADWNGFSSWPFGRFGEQAAARRTLEVTGEALLAPPRLSYPLQLPVNLVPAVDGGGATLELMRFSGRTFDFNETGLAHVGLSPDLIEDMRMHGLTAAQLDPLYRSARGFIDMWQRARNLTTKRDRGWLRWLPSSPTDLIEFEYLDEQRVVEVTPGVAVCRMRGSRRVGSLRNGQCVAVLDHASDVASAEPGELRNANSGYCLSPVNGNLSRGTKLVQLPCDGSAAQLWQFDSQTSNDAEGALRLPAADLCLSAESDRVVLAECEAQSNVVLARIGNTYRIQPALAAAGTQCLHIHERSLVARAQALFATCPPAGRADFHWELDALRDIRDSERLFSIRALSGTVAWQQQPDAALSHAVTAENGAALCRADSRLGVVADGACAIVNRTAGLGVAKNFERLLSATPLVHK